MGQKKAFSALKTEIARATILAYFYRDETTHVIVHVSPVRLGTVLLKIQKGVNVLVCYVSHSLTDCERRYSQTEREALGLVWASERLHPYLYSRKSDLVTDHKPLEVIYGPRTHTVCINRVLGSDATTI